MFPVGDLSLGFNVFADSLPEAKTERTDIKYQSKEGLHPHCFQLARIMFSSFLPEAVTLSSIISLFVGSEG